MEKWDLFDRQRRPLGRTHEQASPWSPAVITLWRPYAWWMAGGVCS